MRDKMINVWTARKKEKRRSIKPYLLWHGYILPISLSLSLPLPSTFHSFSYSFLFTFTICTIIDWYIESDQMPLWKVLYVSITRTHTMYKYRFQLECVLMAFDHLPYRCCRCCTSNCYLNVLSRRSRSIRMMKNKIK